MNADQWDAMAGVIHEVIAERERQHARWGEQDLEDGCGYWIGAGLIESVHRNAVEMQTTGPTFAEVLLEEVGESILAPSRANLRAELVQVAAVAVQWVEAIDRANAPQTNGAPVSRENGRAEGEGKGGGEIEPPEGHYEGDFGGWDANGSEVG